MVLNKIYIRNYNKDNSYVYVKNNRVDLSYQKTGYGTKAFFVCPRCNNKVTFLLTIDNYNKLYCRHCIKAYKNVNIYSIRCNTRPNSRAYIWYRIHKLEKKSGIKFKPLFDYRDWIENKSIKYDYLYEFQFYQNILLSSFDGYTKINPKVVKKALEEIKNNKYSLYELKKYSIKWTEKGSCFIYKY